MEEAKRGSLLRHPGDRGCVGFGRRSSPVNLRASCRADRTFNSHNGVRLSVGIGVLRGVTPASCSRDH